MYLKFTYKLLSIIKHQDPALIVFSVSSHICY